MFQCGGTQRGSFIVKVVPEDASVGYELDASTLLVDGKLRVTGVTVGVRQAVVLPAEGEAPVYDLQGRRVSAPKNGLYIVNGRKVKK